MTASTKHCPDVGLMLAHRPRPSIEAELFQRIVFVSWAPLCDYAIYSDGLVFVKLISIFSQFHS